MIKPKSIDEIMKEMMKAMEMSMYYGMPSTRHQRLALMLARLDIKSAKELLPVGIQIEPLDAVLKSVSFDDKHLKLWK